MNFDVAVADSGLAGLTVALHLTDHHHVVAISKRSLSEGASDWAQGGIAAILGSGGSHDEHVDGTLIVRAGLCDEAATRYIIENGRLTIEWLIGHGMPFTRDEQAGLGLHLTRESSRHHRYIIHAVDATDYAVVATLVEKVHGHPNITLLEDHFTVDLITDAKLGRPGVRCHGLYALGIASGHVKTVAVNRTMMATSGVGRVYLYATNPDTANSNGIAMAWRTGYRVANVEFIQFHPTCLHHPFARSFLITEAVRGEDGKLILPDGTRFIPAHNERAELAPRDTVAHVIGFEMKKRGLNYVYLDISHQNPAFLKEHFPATVAHCLGLGIDITCRLIPVVPAAHYAYGGVVMDHLGRTDITGLYTVGETAYTGLHSANRLAGNSLLEYMVIERGAAEDILAQPPPDSISVWVPTQDESHVTDPDEEVVVSHNWGELCRMMWNYVDIVHTSKRLERAQHHITLLREEITKYYVSFHVNHDLPGLRNLVEAASLIVDSALSRYGSRGLHFLHDYPEMLPEALPTVMQPTHRQIARKRRLSLSRRSTKRSRLRAHLS